MTNTAQKLCMVILFVFLSAFSVYLTIDGFQLSGYYSFLPTWIRIKVIAECTIIPLSASFFSIIAWAFLGDDS